METKHTPGPWGVENCGVGKRAKNLFIWRKEPPSTFGGHGIAEVFSDGATIYGASVWANARLIAAAPELLEAVKRLLSNMETSAEFSDGKNQDMQYAYKAIAKAEGE